MPPASIRRYDVQATYSCLLALASVAPFAAAIVLLFRNLHWSMRQILYSAESLYAPALLGCVLGSMLPAALGFLLGWSSAGQRRNDKPACSWTGFFVGGLVLTFDLILLMAFFMLRLEQAG